MNELERRRLLQAVAATGVAVPLLAACGGDDGGGTSTETTEATSEATSEPTSTAGGTELAATSEIPVGGGAIFAEEKVVVTQPSSGTYKGFSAVCTHRGCTVSDVTDGKIHCACHNSHYNIDDGSVESGPATSALPAESITVSGGKVFLAG